MPRKWDEDEFTRQGMQLPSGPAAPGYGGGFGGQSGQMIPGAQGAAISAPNAGMGMRLPPAPAPLSLAQMRQQAPGGDLSRMAGSINFGDQGAAMEGAVGQQPIGIRTPGQAREGLAADIRTLQESFTPPMSTGMAAHDAAVMRAKQAKLPFGGVPPQSMNALLQSYGQIYPEGMRQAGGIQQTGMKEAGATGRTGMEQAGLTGRTGMQEAGANVRAGLQYGPESATMRQAKTGEGRLALDTQKAKDDLSTKLQELGFKDNEIYLIHMIRMMAEETKKTLGTRKLDIEEREQVPSRSTDMYGNAIESIMEPKYAPAAGKGGPQGSIGDLQGLMEMSDDDFVANFQKADPGIREYLLYIAGIRDRMGGVR